MIWWIIGAWVVVGFIVSFVWHVVVISRESRNLTDSYQRIEEADEYDDSSKVHLAALVKTKFGRRAYKRPWWLYVMAPWLVFTARLPD